MLGEFQDDALFAVNFVFGVGGREDGEEEAFDTNGWFNYVWDKRLISVLIAVFHRFARGFGDIGEVKVSAIGEAHKFFFAIWVVKHKVDGAFGIVGAVCGRDFIFVDMAWV